MFVKKALLALLVCCALLLPGLALGEDFSPGELASLQSATLVWDNKGNNLQESMPEAPLGPSFTVSITDRERLIKLETLLSEAYPIESAGCPFYGQALLTLVNAGGKSYTLEMAFDSCTVFKLGEKYFNYMPKSHRDNFDIRPDNNILFDLFTWQERVRNLDHLDSKALDPLYADWCRAYGQPWTWQAPTWVRFHEVFGPAAQEHVRRHPEDRDSGLYPLYLQRFSWPGSFDMGWEQATQRAWREIQSYPGVGREELRSRLPYAVMLSRDLEQPVWRVHYLDQEQKVEGTPFIELDARTGAVLAADRWPAVIDVVAAFTQGGNQMEAHLRLLPQTTLRPDGKPGYWYHSSLPDWFWQTLDKHPLVNGTRADWEAAYGSLEEFWPVEIKAIQYIRSCRQAPELWQMPSLPGPGQTTAQEALALALTELSATGTLDEAEKARLKPDINFGFDRDSQPLTGHWLIMFRDPDSSFLEVRFSVMIDAGTGLVTESVGPGEGNG